MSPSSAFLAGIREQNLGVYRASPVRLKEDVGQEAEIAHDYRGRLIYELLQNADDAMHSAAGHDDLVVFVLADDALWVGNTGRPLSEADVAGLCGIGASAKSEHSGPRRASIGHKGMGFKSVLEITKTPEAFSTTFRFRMDADLALRPVQDVFREKGLPLPVRAPAMRFPWEVPDFPAQWHDLRERFGINTLFRFPLRSDLPHEQRAILARRLIEVPLTTILFLKHLEQVRIEVAAQDVPRQRTLSVRRQRLRDGRWVDVTGLDASGTYRVEIAEAGLAPWTFLLAHDADVPLAGHRGGLDDYAWEGIEFTEVSVAAPHPSVTEPLPDTWHRFHVFLPTGEPTPWGLLVNGAFATDLSRQEMRVSDATDDYNQYLLSQVAGLFRDRLIDALEHEGAGITDILGLLERAQVHDRGAAVGLHAAMVAALEWLPMLPTPTGDVLAIRQVLVPPAVGADGLGSRFRNLLADDAQVAGLRLPSAELCEARFARILADLGARVATHAEWAELLAQADPERSRLQTHPTADVRIDPVLDTMTEMWAAATVEGRDELTMAARRLPLFPVATDGEGRVRRVATDQATCFYPPRHLGRDVPLDGLRFLLHEICWSRLLPKERNEVLRDRMVAWVALFDIREFRFPDVMRASVLPHLELDTADGTGRTTLESLERLAAICKLSGRTPKPTASLPYQRLGADRALFNLARLPVPVRSTDDAVDWVPAFRAYFGSDWVGDASAELLLEALERAGFQASERPEIRFLVAPGILVGLLQRFSGLEQAATDSDDEEVSLDEDEEGALTGDEREQWLAFFEWIGVNRSLRPIHFHDVEDRATGWLTTRDFRRPGGWAFTNLPTKSWDGFASGVRTTAAKVGPLDHYKPYFTKVHVLDHWSALIKAASSDPTSTVARALYEHIARNWSHLERFSRAEIALVARDKDPGMRAKPPRPWPDETHDAGQDYWLRHLRIRSVIPTRHGPRKASEVWLPSAEATRRFGRRHHAAAELIPIVDVDQQLLEGRYRSFGATLGIRGDLTPATFKPDDAALICLRLRELYGAAAEQDELTPETLRLVIRPAYQNVFELLVRSEETETLDEPPLAEVPLLVTDGASRYRFAAGSEVLHAERPGIRERLGYPDDLWTFVLEARPVARAPLVRLFGARILETQIEWRATIDEDALMPDEQSRFIQELRRLRPYLLSRLQVERSEEQQAAQDIRRLDVFIESIRLVRRVEVSAFLADRELTSRSDRPMYVEAGTPDMLAFVRWGPNAWPPSPFEAEALASALAELYQGSMFEPFLTLIQAHSDDLRKRLLRLAGASTNLEDFSSHGLDEGPDIAPGDELGDMEDAPTAPGADPDDEPEARAPSDPEFRVPLFRPEQLVISGPAVIQGSERWGPDGTKQLNIDRSRSVAVGATSLRYGSLTNLTELDWLGMSVAIAYEHARLGVECPERFVFDVSSPEKYEAARVASSQLQRAVAWLRDHGLDDGWPGFDVFTLDPELPGMPQRLIELKSSGVNATTQAMTWNEWKTARNSEISRYYYLYLAGNLRSDLAHATPFLRAVADPFASLWSEVQTRVHRKVQLDLRQFAQSEYIELAVVQEATG